MLLSETRLTELTMLARDDLRRFFSYNNLMHEAWERAMSEVHSIDPSQKLVASSDVILLTTDFITWLEERRPNAMFPWIQESDTVRLEETSAACAYMKFMRAWLAKLSGRWDSSSSLPIGTRILQTIKFAQFVVAKVSPADGWKAVISPAREEIDLKDYVTWLVLSQSSRTVFIYYNDVLFQDASPDKNLTAALLEKAILHEIGLVRTRLAWLHRQTKGALPLPEFEEEAWIYAHTIRSLASGMRARLDRLLGSDENEWRNI